MRILILSSVDKPECEVYMSNANMVYEKEVGLSQKEGIMSKILKDNIDDHPYTGIREVTGKLRVKTASWLDGHFNGSINCEQVRNITRGKIYDVVRVEGLGDCEDVTIIDDSGNEQTLADFFFEEI